MIEIVKNENDYMELNINDVDFSILNSLRRVMISNVEILAIEMIKIYENNSIVIDDVISHRVGLVPIKRNSDLIKNAKFELDVKFNSKNVNSIQDVLSSSLVSKTDGVKVVHDNIVIAKIKNGQHIKFSAEAILGSGSIHAKWSPSCGTSYRENDDGSYTFFIETVGSMSSDEMFLKSIESLENRLKNYL